MCLTITGCYGPTPTIHPSTVDPSSNVSQLPQEDTTIVTSIPITSSSQNEPSQNPVKLDPSIDHISPTPNVPIIFKDEPKHASNTTLPDRMDLLAQTEWIPLDDPVFSPASENTYLDALEPVLGLDYKGESRAYPIRILSHHRIVNDSLRGSPLLVAY